MNGEYKRKTYKIKKWTGVKVCSGNYYTVYSRCTQGIIDPTETETRPIFSCMFVMAKIFNELFTLYWNGIAVSVQYVSSMIVVSGAISND